MSSTEPSDSTASPELLRHEREELAAFIELLYWRNGTVPTAQDINQAFGFDLTDEQFNTFIRNPKIKKYLVEERNVPLEAKARLTPQQLDYIRVMTDPLDMRPMAIKLK